MTLSLIQSCDHGVFALWTRSCQLLALLEDFCAKVRIVPSESTTVIDINRAEVQHCIKARQFHSPGTILSVLNYPKFSAKTQPTTTMSTNVLITGANRGLGKELLRVYLARPNHIVIAANRDPEHPTSKALVELFTGENSRLVVTKLDVSVESDHAEAVAQLAAQGIDRLDVVIANAAVAYIYPRVAEVATADLQAHLTPNVFGVVWLYQATRGLLQKSENPKWVSMGSGAAWLEYVLQTLNTLLV